jgi:HAD superfamily hydrolase (TIGR01509 family)
MLVIFDCDGVLVDSERLSHQVLVEMLNERGVAIGFDATVALFIGASMAAGMVTLRDLLGGEVPAGFLPEMGRRTKAAFRAGLTVVPGIEALLDALRQPFCVASNGDHAKVNFTLGHTGLLPRFAGRIFTADDVAHPKPAPDLFLHAARTLGAAPQRTTVVEDSPTGIRAAKAAGMRAIGFAAMTPATLLLAAGADVVAQTLAEVQALLAAQPRGPGSAGAP